MDESVRFDKPEPGIDTHSAYIAERKTAQHVLYPPHRPSISAIDILHPLNGNGPRDLTTITQLGLSAVPSHSAISATARLVLACTADIGEKHLV